MTLTFKEYQRLSRRTQQYGPDAVTNATFGIAGEAGEVVDVIKKGMFHGHDVKAKLAEELGDLLFYADWLASLHGLSLGEIAAENVEKLKRRYPDAEGFSAERSINREEVTA